jgi:hypothetical protein
MLRHAKMEEKEMTMIWGKGEQLRLLIVMSNLGKKVNPPRPR